MKVKIVFLGIKQFSHKAQYTMSKEKYIQKTKQLLFERMTSSATK